GPRAGPPPRPHDLARPQADHARRTLRGGLRPQVRGRDLAGLLPRVPAARRAAPLAAVIHDGVHCLSTASAPSSSALTAAPYAASRLVWDSRSPCGGIARRASSICCRSRSGATTARASAPAWRVGLGMPEVRE